MIDRELLDKTIMEALGKATKPMTGYEVFQCIYGIVRSESVVIERLKLMTVNGTIKVNKVRGYSYYYV
jgi:hypothetical protein